MRNHRLFGVVIAVLLSTSFLHQRPNAPHHAQRHNAVPRLGGAGIQLASSAVPADLADEPDTPGPPRSNVLNPARARYMDAVWSWVTYVNAHTPPPPALPTVVALAAPVRAHAVTLTPAPITPVAPATAAASGGVWSELRHCESGGNYADDTGNGYYGAYQFSLGTWHGLGFSGLPSSAAPAVQDQAAQELQARSGWGQWPACSRKLRLT